METIDIAISIRAPIEEARELLSDAISYRYVGIYLLVIFHKDSKSV